MFGYFAKGDDPTSGGEEYSLGYSASGDPTSGIGAGTGGESAASRGSSGAGACEDLVEISPETSTSISRTAMMLPSFIFQILTMFLSRTLVETRRRDFEK